VAWTIEADDPAIKPRINKVIIRHGLLAPDDNRWALSSPSSPSSPVTAMHNTGESATAGYMRARTSVPQDWSTRRFANRAKSRSESPQEAGNTSGRAGSTTRRGAGVGISA
jgi:hypothetical protein